MKKLNVILLAVAAGLFLLSAFSYRESVTRAERFERGQKFLPNLNPDAIAEIEIETGDEKTHLRRDGDRFVVVDAHGYPAKNEAVNRFIRDVLEIGLEKRVGRGESLEQELGLVPEENDGAVTVRFKDTNQADMVHFVIGEESESGGSAIRRLEGEDQTIYLTSSRTFLNTAHDDFLDKEILDVETDDIAAIRGDGFAIERLNGSLELADLPAGKKESSKVGQLKNLLSGLRFQKHYLADDPAVQGLVFDSVVEVELDDQSGYQVAVAEQGDKHYLKIQGFHDAGQQTITVDADEEEVRKTSEVLARQDEIRQFNDFHGSWIYEVTETTADRVRVAAGDLVEDA